MEEAIHWRWKVEWKDEGNDLGGIGGITRDFGEMLVECGRIWWMYGSKVAEVPPSCAGLGTGLRSTRVLGSA